MSKDSRGIYLYLTRSIINKSDVFLLMLLKGQARLIKGSTSVVKMYEKPYLIHWTFIIRYKTNNISPVKVVVYL